MKRQLAAVIATFTILGSGHAFAQEAAPGPGTVEVTVIPGGGTFFTSGDKGPSFGSYNLGGALTYNVNRIVGIEGEVGGTLGIAQDLQFAGSADQQDEDARSTELHGERRGVGSDARIGGAVRRRRDRRPDHVRAPGSRRQRHDDAADGQRRRRPEVVRAKRPLGAARRLPIRVRSLRHERSGVLRAGNAVRTPRLRRRDHQRHSMTP